MFHELETDTCHFQAQGNVLICGDLNARTGLHPDILNSQGDHFIAQNTPFNTIFSHRKNFDSSTNRNGKDLLQLCRSLGLYIANGRLRGDPLGKFTFCSPHGNSTVDYMVTDIDTFSIKSFTVQPLTPLSDHSQITMYLKKRGTNTTPTQPSKLSHLRNPYRWAQNSTEPFQKAIGSREIQTLLDTFLETTYAHTKEGVDLAVNNINSIFEKTAEKAQLKKKKKINPKFKKEDIWFDLECQNMRKELRNLSNHKHRDPNNMNIRLLYCEMLKKYKRTLRSKKAQYTKKHLQVIEQSINSNNFWTNWNNLKQKRPEELAIQNGEIWTNHFQTLFQNINLTTNLEQHHIHQKLTQLEYTIKDNQNPIDLSITEMELKN